MCSTSHLNGRSRVRSSVACVGGNLDWVIDVLPLVAFYSLAHGDGQEAVYPFLQRYNSYRKYLELYSQHACFLMAYLLDFLNVHDPWKKSTVFKMLEKVDRGFKKLNAFRIIINRKAAKQNNISPTRDWNNLDYLLGWVKANAVPRLDAIPELIAVEALDVHQNKSRQWAYYDMFFNKNVRFEELRLRIEKDEKRELKALAKAQRELKTEMDARTRSRFRSSYS
ncbi:hypothetical protein FBEOM_7198 [Fusarium beomiforme]|uniref:Uncharacterized protein n=1 Tax=Fusarium beomiforme TaxID=44412 RepID=A0A9P5DVF7_9HYPO|nr:hypothetical protein FBEOM_7198 [Fusarium beomiforme]